MESRVHPCTGNYYPPTAVHDIALHGGCLEFDFCRLLGVVAPPVICSIPRSHVRRYVPRLSPIVLVLSLLEVPSLQQPGYGHAITRRRPLKVVRCFNSQQRTIDAFSPL